jgi:hypothetical protein
VKYWAYFGAKLAVAAGVSAGALWGVRYCWPVRQYFMPMYTPRVGYHLVEYTYVPRFGFDLPFTLAVLGWFLLTCGLLYLAVLDQRYRCRVCVRKLRMPVSLGSWSKMLQFGRPTIEYICPYGHGRLNVEQVQIAGAEPPEWSPQREDPWEELCSLMKSDGEK